jgi:hypothetical protein
MFNSLKAAAAKNFINPYLAGIGTIEELEIDKEQKSVIAHLALSGEPQPVRIEVHGYILGPDSITIPRFTCSKSWIEAALNQFLANRAFKLPQQARSAIKLVL